MDCFASLAMTGLRRLFSYQVVRLLQYPACFSASAIMVGDSGTWWNFSAPNERSASSTPDATTAPTAMQPASPTPLTPSGLSGDGVSRCRIETLGISVA